MPRSKDKKDKEENQIFNSIRKPTAPPAVKFGEDRPQEKQMPSLRKAKHKRSNEAEPER